MNAKKISPLVEPLLKDLINSHAPLAAIISKIAAHNGTAVLVGGAVRDIYRTVLSSMPMEPAKDLDIEVYGLNIEQLHEILSAWGPVNTVGKSFGVLKIAHTALDWSLPRSDSTGRHPEVTINPFMDYKKAFARRDLTINAMGIDLNSFELIDPFNGLSDLENKILRAPDADLFVEDPLRLFRVMQFMSRFSMQPDATLNSLCKVMVINTVSLERIEAEFDKLMLQSKRPSLGIRWLAQIDRLKEILPELYDTITVEQNPEWHPEGSVFEHTMQAIDAAALQSYTTNGQQLIVMYAVLCHDLGKVSTTKIIDGIIRSPGHDLAGVPLAKALLRRITRRVELVQAVAKLVRDHMSPGQFIANNAGNAAYKRLALRLAPEASIALLGQVAIADKQGRNGQSHEPLKATPSDILEFLKKAEAMQVTLAPEEPMLKGADIIDQIKPGPEMGRVLKRAYEIQIEEGITDKDALLKRVIK